MSHDDFVAESRSNSGQREDASRQLWQCDQNFRGALLSCTVKAIVEYNISLGTETGVKGAVKAS